MRILIGLVLVVYAICYLLVHKNMVAIHDFIENSAINHTVRRPIGEIATE